MAKNLKKFFQNYFHYLGKLIKNIDSEDIEKIIDIFEAARKERRHIFFLGNGGSAVTAMHFANDLGALPLKRGGFKAISLVDNIAAITAISNDYGYRQSFVRQIERLFNAGDVVVAISASGNSENILNALEYANKNKGISIALVGFDGGRARKIAKHCLWIKTHKGDYGPVEDIHLMLDHLITAYFLYKIQTDIR